MSTLHGYLHDGQTSQSIPATLTLYPDGSVRIRIDGERSEETLPLETLSVPSRIGSTPRRIQLGDGREFETSDNDTADEIFSRRRGTRDWPAWLEGRLSVVTIAIVVSLLAGGLFATRGIPAIARIAAFAITPELNARLEASALKLLDQTLEASTLPEETRTSLERRFESIVSQADSEQSFALYFRAGGIIGANAFALPGGSVIVTDELVELAEDESEVVAVLAHEVGHVVERHGLRQTLQSSMLAIVVILMTGDLSSSSGFVAALPTAIVESHFSRDFEREADDYAMGYLAANGLDPRLLGTLLLRMEEANGTAGFDISFLATHPTTAERMQRLAASPHASDETGTR